MTTAKDAQALAAYVAAMEQQHGHTPLVRDGALVDQRDEDRFAGWRLRGEAPAELLEALRSTRGVLACALKSAAPDFFATDEDIASHLQFQKIDAAIANATQQRKEPGA